MAINALLQRPQSSQLWEHTVDHPFVLDLTKGKLPHDKFRDYIVQDKILCGAIRGFVCNLLADCPDIADFESLHTIVADMQGYRHEGKLFEEMFGALKLSHHELHAHPNTVAFMDFLWKVGSRGTLEEKLVVLYGLEGSYMEWAERAHKRGDVPSDKVYAKWLEIHSGSNLGKIVEWIKSRLDKLVGNHGLNEHHHKLFQRTLQHEIMFWDAAYIPGRKVVFAH